MKDNNLTHTLMQIAKLSKSIEIDLDANGRLRSLTTTNKGGLQQLYSCPVTNNLKAKVIDEIDAFFIAHQFINSSIVKSDLQLANMELEIGNITPFAFGYRISCEQMATSADKKTLLPVYGGAIHIAINTVGKIFSLTSTLQYGKIESQSKTCLSKSAAIKIASANGKGVAGKRADKSRPYNACAQLILVAKGGRLLPAYEVTLVCQPGKSYTCIVLANTGEIIERRKLAHVLRLEDSREEEHGRTYAHPYGESDSAKSGFVVGVDCIDPCSPRPYRPILALVEARALLKTPDPAKSISKQASKTIVENLPNPQVLRNAYLDMFTGKNMDMVYANADDTFCYGVNQAEFAAVSVYLSLADQIELYLQSGMAQPQQALPVVINDTSLKDNAYFDPLHYEIHLGVGTGVKHGGLTRHIAYDLGVANHEFGHVLVHWQAVGGELAGAQGVAINEAVGDVLGTLVMDYMSRIWYAKQLGCKLTKRDLQNDARVIGKYALPPFGIRTQKNERTAPEDLTGEPHADGLVIGSALADLLIAMATKPSKSIEEQIRLFVKISLMALALLPSYRVMFPDMERALITADQQICAGQYRSTIEGCFRKHGITLDTTLAKFSAA